ncbi:hypothetical protein RUND412_001629 [Rhizina undulata]
MSSLQALLNPAPSGPPHRTTSPPQRHCFFTPYDSKSSSENHGSSSPVPPVSPPRRVLRSKSEVEIGGRSRVDPLQSLQLSRRPAEGKVGGKGERDDEEGESYREFAAAEEEGACKTAEEEKEGC